MGGAAKVKEAVMNAAAAAHQHVAGDAGVKAAGDQRQHIFWVPIGKPPMPS